MARQLDYFYQPRKEPSADVSVLPFATPFVSIVIPTKNEAKNLPHVLPRIPDMNAEIILVDGNSTDDTVAAARRLCPEIRVVYQSGRGKGDALRTGFEAARGEIIVMLDADGSMAPEEIPAYVGALMAGADYAKGTRFLHGAGTDDMEFHRYLGNLGFVIAVRLLFGGSYSDLCYGYCAFWKRVLPQLNLTSDGFEIETEMNVRALRSRIKVVEVPSYESRRIHGASNLSALRDGLRVLGFIVKERLNRPHQRQPPQKTIERVQDEFTPAMTLLLQEAEHLARRRSQLPHNVYRDSVEALKAAVATLMASNTDNLQYRRQQELYRRQAATVWTLLE
jgi:glycosyltransferase involved in cell wall biosynthesis